MVVRSLYPSIAHPPLLSVCVDHGLYLYIPPGVDSPRGSGDKQRFPRVSWISPEGNDFSQEKIPLPGGGKPRLLRYVPL